MALGTMEQRTKGMKKHAEELIEQAYQRGFKAGQEDLQEKQQCITDEEVSQIIDVGRNQTWDAVKKIVRNVSDGGISVEDLKKIFGYRNICNIVINFSASEAIEKIREYEEEKAADGEICVGDEIIYDIPCYKGVVISIDNRVNFITNNFEFLSERKECLKKTGRHFDAIAEILEKMKNGE